MKKQTAFIALGSNMGRRMAHLRRALTLLRNGGGIRLIRTSKVYETSPVGPRQRDFLNAAVKIETDLSPQALLRRLQEIERAIGRVQNVSSRRREIPRRSTEPGNVHKWGPRPIDLDILFYGKARVKLRGLEIPHPRYRERKFVLKPLADIAATFVPPGSRRGIGRILARLTDAGQKVKLHTNQILP